MPSYKSMARDLGVCQATISNILNGHMLHKASTETIDRVVKYAETVGWKRRPLPTIPPVPETDLAWAAGIIDGEGYIGITRDRCENPASTNKSISYRSDVKVTMCHEATIAKLRSIFAIGCATRTVVPRNPKHSRQFTWQVRSLQAQAVLVAIRPYLVTKADDADTVLEFCNLPHSRTGRGGLTSEMQSERERLYWLSRNQKIRKFVHPDDESSITGSI